MPYIGNQPAANFASVTKDEFSGDGSETAFTLSKAATTNGVAVFVENVRQEPTTAYSVSGTTLTFTAAPVSSSGNNIYVLHHNAVASTANHPASQDLTAVKGTFTSTVDINGQELILDADADTSITADTDDQIDFRSGGTDKMVLGSNGFLGIAPSGGVTPGQILELDRSSESSADVAVYFNGNGVDWTLGTDASDSGFLKFSNNATVGTSTSMFLGASNRVNMSSTSTAGRLNLGFSHSTGMVGIDMIPDATTATMLNFKNSGGTVAGSITTGGSSTAFNTSSDYRLKENVSYDWDATSKLKQLKPARFNWIDDETNTLIGGFLAHEVSNIVPEAVTGTKDGTRDVGTIKDKDNNIVDKDVIEAQAKKDEGQTWTKTKTEDVYQQIDQSKLVPLLVKTIQELEARVTALESK